MGGRLRGWGRGRAFHRDRVSGLQEEDVLATTAGMEHRPLSWALKAGPDGDSGSVCVATIYRIIIKRNTPALAVLLSG